MIRSIVNKILNKNLYLYIFMFNKIYKFKVSLMPFSKIAEHIYEIYQIYAKHSNMTIFLIWNMTKVIRNIQNDIRWLFRFNDVFPHSPSDGIAMCCEQSLWWNVILIYKIISFNEGHLNLYSWIVSITFFNIFILLKPCKNWYYQDLPWEMVE